MGRLMNDDEDGAVEALVTLYRGGMSMETIKALKEDSGD